MEETRTSLALDENEKKTFLAIETMAYKIFEELDFRLAPNLNIVKVYKNTNEIYIYPENIKIDMDFMQIKQFSEQLMEVTQRSEQESFSKDETKAILNAFNTKFTIMDLHRVYFYSSLVEVKNTYFFLSLSFEKEIYESKYKLIKTYNRGVINDNNSLLNAITNEYLKQCVYTLKDILKGEDEDFQIDLNLVFRRACENLVKRVTYSFVQNKVPLNLFESLNSISALRYEGNEGVGELVLTPKNHPNVESILYLDSPVKLTDSKAVRKLLEISNEDEFQLLSDGIVVYGFGKSKGLYNPNHEDRFLIKFKTHYTWELHHTIPMLKVVNGQPSIKDVPIEREEFIQVIKQVFEEIEDDVIPRLYALVEAAKGQKKGTILVISGEAAEEANRLSAQCTKVKPIELTQEMMEMVSVIDGAVLVDCEARVHAIGTILDGIATSNGDSTRGSRYNSAVKYSDTRKGNCLLVVVSEDKYANLVFYDDQVN
ncbi:diadenylate cyclase [Priestia sp. 179-F W1.4 NHS]|uniref:diadenylate cyclase n=1 Tax=Priestia sp. 179-F W1.4 NHS TaxID=3374296 RepID=UPI0038791FD3